MEHSIQFRDAQQLAREHPDSFEAPSEQKLAALKPGDIVKVCDGKERFWTIIKDIAPNGIITASVNNVLVSGQHYGLNSIVKFSRRHIYDVYPRY